MPKGIPKNKVATNNQYAVRNIAELSAYDASAKVAKAFEKAFEPKVNEPESAMLTLTGTSDVQEQAERVQKMMYAPVIALTVVWDGRMDCVTSIVASANLSPTQIMGMLSDALKFSAASMQQMEQRAKAAQNSVERTTTLPPNDSQRGGD